MTDDISTIIEQNQRLIYSIINKYKYYAEEDDLYQVSIIGLINAYQNYDNSLHTKFSSYAYMYIIGEINKFINDNKAIKVNKKYVQLFKKIMQAKNCLTQSLMREPSILELANFIGIDIDTINQVFQYNYQIDSLDRNVVNDEEANLYDFIPNNDYGDNDERLFIEEQLSRLSKEERELIINRYYYDKTQAEMAVMMGTNQVQAYRQEQKVLTKIRRNMGITK